MTDDGNTSPAPPLESSERETYSVAAKSASIAGWTFVSRVTGFVRAVVIAAVLGPTFFGNLFQSLNTFPNLLYELVLGSLLASLLVPPLVAALDDDDEMRARRIADGVLGLTTILFVAVAVVVVAASPLLLRAFAVGIHDPVIREEQRRIGFLLLLVLLPQTALYGLAATGAAVQNARGRFALAAAAPVGENVVVIATFLLCGRLFDTGLELGAIEPRVALLLASGSTAAVAVHASVQWYGAKRVGHALVPRRGWRDPDVRALVGLAIRSFGYALVSALRVLVLLITAGTVKGGVVALQFAYNFYYLPGALVAKPLSVASLPILARLARTGSKEAFHNVYRATFRAAQLLTMPAVVILGVLAVPISRVVAHGAMASSDGRALLAIALASLALGVIGDVGCIISTGSSYARRDAVGPFVAMTVRAGLVGAAAVASSVAEGEHRLLALALGASGADLVASALFNRREGSFGRERSTEANGAVRILACGLAAALAGVVVRELFDAMVGDGAAAAVLSVEVAVVAGVYFAAARALGVLRLDAFRALRAAEAHADEPGPQLGHVASSVRAPLRPFRTHIAEYGALLAAALCAAAIGAVTPIIDVAAPVGVLAVLFVAVVYRNPPIGAYVLLGLGPLIVGIDRGSLVPLLRLNEALILVVVGAVFARAIIAPTARVHISGADASVVLITVCGAAIPLAVRFYRAGSLTSDELLYTAPLIKLAVVYSVFRVVIKTVAELRTAMIVAISSAATVSIIGIAQILDVFGVRSFLASGLFYTSGDVRAVSGGRGTSTIGSSIGAAGFYVLALMIAIAWLQHREAPVRILRPLTFILLLGLAGTAQFSALIALPIGLYTIQRMSASDVLPRLVPDRHRARALVGTVLLAATAWIAFAPRLGALASGRLPQSWNARWENLDAHFLPPLHVTTNVLLGVTPVSVVSDPRGFVPAIWIESGYVWLIWTGGVLLALAFIVMVTTHMWSASTAARNRQDEFGIVSVAATASLAILCGLMVLDPHLTIRGTGDLLFPLLGLAATAASGRARAPTVDDPMPAATGPQLSGSP